MFVFLEHFAASYQKLAVLAPAPWLGRYWLSSLLVAVLAMQGLQVRDTLDIKSPFWT